MPGGLTRIAVPAAAVAALGIEGDDPRVVEVAEEIRAAHAPEIEQLDAWGQDRGSAEAVVRDQRAEIDAMRALLDRL